MSTENGNLYPALARKFHDAESEALISAFWQENRTFERSIEQRARLRVGCVRAIGRLAHRVDDRASRSCGWLCTGH